MKIIYNTDTTIIIQVQDIHITIHNTQPYIGVLYSSGNKELIKLKDE